MESTSMNKEHAAGLAAKPPSKLRIGRMTVRGNYPNWRSLIGSSGSLAPARYNAPVVRYEVLDGTEPASHETTVRDVELPILCGADRDRARQSRAARR